METKGEGIHAPQIEHAFLRWRFQGPWLVARAGSNLVFAASFLYSVAIIELPIAPLLRLRLSENGEPAEYLPAGEDPTHRGYTNGFGYIAVTTNLEGNGRVLLGRRLDDCGRRCFALVLMNDSKMGPILRKASQPAGLGNFEVLLGADFLKSSSPDVQVLATRFYLTATENRIRPE